MNFQAITASVVSIGGILALLWPSAKGTVLDIIGQVASSTSDIAAPTHSLSLNYEISTTKILNVSRLINKSMDLHITFNSTLVAGFTKLTITLFHSNGFLSKDIDLATYSITSNQLTSKLVVSFPFIDGQTSGFRVSYLLTKKNNQQQLISPSSISCFTNKLLQQFKSDLQTIKQWTQISNYPLSVDTTMTDSLKGMPYWLLDFDTVFDNTIAPSGHFGDQNTPYSLNFQNFVFFCVKLFDHFYVLSIIPSTNGALDATVISIDGVPSSFLLDADRLRMLNTTPRENGLQYRSTMESQYSLTSLAALEPIVDKVPFVFNNTHVANKSFLLISFWNFIRSSYLNYHLEIIALLPSSYIIDYDNKVLNVLTVPPNLLEYNRRKLEIFEYFFGDGVSKRASLVASLLELKALLSYQLGQSNLMDTPRFSEFSKSSVIKEYSSSLATAGIVATTGERTYPVLLSIRQSSRLTKVAYGSLINYFIPVDDSDSFSVLVLTTVGSVPSIDSQIDYELKTASYLPLSHFQIRDYDFNHKMNSFINTFEDTPEHRFDGVYTEHPNAEPEVLRRFTDPDYVNWTIIFKPIYEKFIYDTWMVPYLAQFQSPPQLPNINDILSLNSLVSLALLKAPGKSDICILDYIDKIDPLLDLPRWNLKKDEVDLAVDSSTHLMVIGPKENSIPEWAIDNTSVYTIGSLESSQRYFYLRKLRLSKGRLIDSIVQDDSKFRSSLVFPILKINANCYSLDTGPFSIKMNMQLLGDSANAMSIFDSSITSLHNLLQDWSSSEVLQSDIGRWAQWRSTHLNDPFTPDFMDFSLSERDFNLFKLIDLKRNLINGII